MESWTWGGRETEGLLDFGSQEKKGLLAAVLCARPWALDLSVPSSTAWLAWSSCSSRSHARSHTLGHLYVWDSLVPDCRAVVG